MGDSEGCQHETYTYDHLNSDGSRKTITCCHKCNGEWE